MFEGSFQCWTAPTTKIKGSNRENILVAACDSTDPLQKFIQINGRIHLKKNRKICSGYEPAYYWQKHSQNHKFKTEMQLFVCHPQLFGEDVIDADSCQGTPLNQNSVAEPARLIKDNFRFTSFKSEDGNGELCLFKNVNKKASFGPCKAGSNYKIRYSAKKKQVKKGKNCLTAASTERGGSAKWIPCASSGKKKLKQQWVYEDGKLVLSENSNLALQYAYATVKRGKTVNAKTGPVMATVFGDVFSYDDYSSSSYSSFSS